MNQWPKIGVAALLISVMVAAACAIIYQLLIGSIASLFLGSSIEQFSLTIGFFLFFMGVGSWFSKFIERNLLLRFIQVELGLAVIGGSSVGCLYVLYSTTEHFRYGMILLVAFTGTLIGLEIPLLTRFIRLQDSLKSTLANVLSMDYCGSLIAALIFPFLLLPFLGSMKSALLTGLINWIVAGAVIWVFRNGFLGDATKKVFVQWIFAGMYLLILLLFSERLIEKWEHSFYAGSITFQKQSQYQQITLTQAGNRFRLYLDGHLQFDSFDEYRYHESIVHPVFCTIKEKADALIIGGGDGLTLREVLKHKEVKNIVLVELDPVVVSLAMNNPYMRSLNSEALSDDRVQIINTDGFKYLKDTSKLFDIIIFDLPDPREESLSKLYSLEGYRMARIHLKENGAIVTQATSPYFAPNAYWCIGETIQEAGFKLKSYHVNIPSFGEWGFHIGYKNSFGAENIEFPSNLKYLDETTWNTMCLFPKDMKSRAVKINRLDQPSLAHYYRQDWNLLF
ncbi:MAG: polyamine aminopropyltransferase [Candidatus Latescibacterota bacterium]|nr:polyamine aminopropyltransferase [Candidatus Latescibacterota bacterium]